MQPPEDESGPETPLDEDSHGAGARRPGLAALGALVFACGLGWLAFLIASAAQAQPGMVWQAAALALPAVPCFSFGRQWALEGLGRSPVGIGARWRPAVGGLVLVAYGAAFILGPTQLAGDGASAAAHGVLCFSLTPAGLLMVVAGLALAARREPPEFLLRQMRVLLVLCGLGPRRPWSRT